MSNTTDISEVYLEASTGPRILAAVVTTYALATLAVTLRFVARKISKAPLWWDDWLIVIALLPSTGMTIAVPYGVAKGIGHHIQAASVEALQTFGKILWAGEFFYPFSLGLTKSSICMLYWRIFKHSSIKMPLCIIGAVTTGWWVSCVFTVIFQCHPISRGHDPLVPGICIDQKAYFIYSGAVSAVTDLALLVLPLPYVWSLQLARSKKFALSCVFLLGSFVCVVSIYRLYVIVVLDLANQDIMWNLSDTVIWGFVEVNIAIVCACLPLLRPLFASTHSRTGANSCTSKSIGASGSHDW